MGTVDNCGKRKYRRYKTHIGVKSDTPPDKLIVFAEGIREIIRTRPYTRKDCFEVYLNEFSVLAWISCSMSFTRRPTGPRS